MPCFIQNLLLSQEELHVVVKCLEKLLSGQLCFQPPHVFLTLTSSLPLPSQLSSSSSLRGYLQCFIHMTMHFAQSPLAPRFLQLHRGQDLTKENGRSRRVERVANGGASQRRNPFHLRPPLNLWRDVDHSWRFRTCILNLTVCDGVKP